MLETIIWVGISQALFASVLILSKKEKSVSDRILAGWLILMAIEFFTFIIDLKVYGKPLLSSSFLLINPAFYLYVISLTRPGFRLRTIHLLHLVPFLFFETFAYVIQEVIPLSDFFIPDENFSFRLIFGLSNIVSWALYNYMSISELNRHSRNILQEFSSMESGRKLAWVFSIVIFYNLYCFTLLATGISVVFTGKYMMLPHVINYSMMLFIIYMLGFYGLRQRVIYPAKEDLDSGPDEKYGSSMLSPARKEEIKSSILRIFELQKPYLNSDLNMDMLSEMTGLPKHHITEVLNMELKNNFFNFVNSYRIDAVKKMLADKSNPYSIEAIGYECGFNSKSSFFSVFKKMTGMTPMSYRSSQ
jgi:AraC-like DNA-binding protein